MNKQFELKLEGDDLYFRADQASDYVPVRLIRLRPFDGSLTYLSIMHISKKRELFLIRTEADIPVQFRSLIERVLAQRYFTPAIEAINTLFVRLGNYYLDVQTDLGPKKIVVSSPQKNVQWLAPTQCLIQDTSGCYYRVDDLSKMDRKSQAYLQSAF